MSIHAPHHAATRCYLCGSHHLNWRYRVRERLLEQGEYFDIVQCASCSFVQTIPQPAADKLSRYYPAHYGAYADIPVPPFLPIETPTRLSRLKLRLKKAVLRTHYGYDGGLRPGLLEKLQRLALEPLRASFQVPPPYREGRRLLDIGCGAGRYLEFAKQLGWEVHGVERDPDVAERVRQRIGATVACDRFESVRYPDRSFDVVSFWHVIEHLYDPRAALKEARRILKPNGYVLIGVPNYDCWQRKVFGRWWWYWEVPRHFWHFTPETLNELLKQSGFRIERLYHQPLLQPFNVVLGLLYMLGDAFPKFRHPRWRRGGNFYRTGVALLPLGYLLRWLGGSSKMVVLAQPEARTQ